MISVGVEDGWGQYSVNGPDKDRNLIRLLDWAVGGVQLELWKLVLPRCEAQRQCAVKLLGAAFQFRRSS
jgi:hypothetical protein